MMYATTDVIVEIVCRWSRSARVRTPMSLLQRDEKYTDETIAILHDFKRDRKMAGTAQVRIHVHLHVSSSFGYMEEFPPSEVYS